MFNIELKGKWNNNSLHFLSYFGTIIRNQYNDGLYNVSGINCRGDPLNIIYNTTGGDDTSFYQYTDVATAANIYGVNKKGFSQSEGNLFEF